MSEKKHLYHMWQRWRGAGAVGTPIDAQSPTHQTDSIGTGRKASLSDSHSAKSEYLTEKSAIQPVFYGARDYDLNRPTHEWQFHPGNEQVQFYETFRHCRRPNIRQLRPGIFTVSEYPVADPRREIMRHRFAYNHDHALHKALKIDRRMQKRTQT